MYPLSVLLNSRGRFGPVVAFQGSQIMYYTIYVQFLLKQKISLSYLSKSFTKTGNHINLSNCPSLYYEFSYEVRLVVNRIICLNKSFCYVRLGMQKHVQIWNLEHISVSYKLSVLYLLVHFIFYLAMMCSLLPSTYPL